MLDQRSSLGVELEQNIELIFLVTECKCAVFTREYHICGYCQINAIEKPE